MQLRPYQQHGIDALRDCYRSGKRAPIYTCATGSGKTVLAAFVVKRMVQQGKRVLYLVHRRELLHQTSRTLRSADLPHGLIGPREPKVPCDVQVASVQTLARRPGTFPDPDLIIVDEAHHARAGTWRSIIEARPDARLLGLTATPERLDGKGLGIAAGGLFDALVCGPSMGELIAEGYLSEYRAYAPAEAVDTSALHTRGGDFVTRELAELMDTPSITGDAVQHYERLCPKAPALAFCVSIQHAQDVAAGFRRAGFRADSIDGTMPESTRDKRVADLASGQLHVLTSCEILGEGFDCPVVSAAILLRPTQSMTLHLQQNGRAMRPCEQWPVTLILDHAGNLLRHGLPDDDRQWSLAGRNTRQAAASPASPWQCAQCFRINAQHLRTCPECGFVRETREREIEQRDGTLRELSASEWTNIANARRWSARAEQGRASSLDDLLKIQKERGYSPGWAHHVFAARGCRRKVAV